MSYTLEALSKDCRDALMAENNEAGRAKVRDFVAKACADEGFVTSHLGPEANKERDIVYEDPDLGFVSSRMSTKARNPAILTIMDRVGLFMAKQPVRPK